MTPNEDNTDEFDMADTYRVDDDTLYDAMGGEERRDAEDQAWLFNRLEDVLVEAIEDRDIHPLGVTAALVAFNASFRARVTAAMNLRAQDSPFGTLGEEFEKAARMGMPYHRFMTAMDQLDDDHGHGVVAMTPDDLPPEVREQVESAVAQMAPDSDPRGMYE